MASLTPEMITAIVVSVLASPVLVSLINKISSLLFKTPIDKVQKEMEEIKAMINNHVQSFLSYEREQVLTRLDILCSEILEKGRISTTEIRELALLINSAHKRDAKISVGLQNKIQEVEKITRVRGA